MVTEHGVAAADDAERVEFIRGGLEALHAVLDDGIPLRGYIHWSAFDNFEWALGYAMQFGLIAVDRTTQERTPKPSARFLGRRGESQQTDGPGSSDPGVARAQTAQDRRLRAGPGYRVAAEALAPTARTCQRECHR